MIKFDNFAVIQWICVTYLIYVINVIDILQLIISIWVTHFLI